MKRYIILLIFMVFAGISAADNEADNKTLPYKSSSYEFGPEIFSHEYKEFVNSQTFMKEKGTFYGVSFNSYNRSWAAESTIKPGYFNKWMTCFEGEFAYGRVNYDGALQDANNTPIKEKGIDDFLMNFRFLVGPDFIINDSLLTPYLGLGYRYLFDDSSSDSDLSGYLRESNYFYVPAGLKMDCYKKNGWSIGGRAEFDLFLIGLQISEIYGIDFKNKQDSGYGLLASIDIVNRGEKSIFKIRPFVRYWDIEKSDMDSGVYEPENETTQYGIQLIFEF